MNLIGEIFDCELCSHGSRFFFSAKTNKKLFLQESYDNILCFLILEFGEARGHGVFCNLISCKE